MNNEQNKKTTILHLCSIKGRGGTGYMASRLCKFIAEKGMKVIVGCCKGSKVEERAIKNKLELLSGLKLRRGFHPISLLNDIIKIRRCIAENSINIIHTWHSIEYWTAAIATIGTTVKLARTRGLVTPFKNNLVNRFIHNKTAILHVTCKKIEDNYRQAGFKMDNIKLIHDGVDIKKFNPQTKPKNIRSEINISNEGLLFAVIGRLEPVKGHKHLLKALEIIMDKGYNFNVVIAGDGSLHNKLQSKIRSSKLNSRVHLLGVRNDIPEILTACDVFILSSIGSEGSSRGTQEAMASGLPCLTTNVGMLPDIIKNGENGYTVQPKKPTEMAEKLELIIKDSATIKTMGEVSRKMAEDTYSEDIFAEKIVEEYKKQLT